MREWTLKLPSELPFWELESQWTLESSKNDCKGQNPLDWGVPYIIEKLLELKCLQSACMTHLDTSNTSYDRKKSRKSNCLFDSQPLKVRNCPDFLACRWRDTYCWKDFKEGYNFVLDFILIGGLETKLWASKVTRVLTLGISGLPFGSHGTKCHLGAGLVAKHKVYYKGRRWWLPSSPGRGCLWLACAPTCSNYALTNLSFGLCTSVWESEFLVDLFSPIPELQHAPLPLKCCEPRSAP